MTCGRCSSAALPKSGISDFWAGYGQMPLPWSNDRQPGRGGGRGDAVAMRAGCGAVAETRFIWGRSLPWSRSGRRAGLGIGYLAGAGLVGMAWQRAMGALTRSKPGARCSGQRIVYMVRGRFHYRAGALTGCAGRVACAGCTSAGAPALVTIWTGGGPRDWLSVGGRHGLKGSGALPMGAGAWSKPKARGSGQRPAARAGRWQGVPGG